MTDSGQGGVEPETRQANAAIEAAATGFLIFDRAGSLSHANPAAIRLLPFLSDQARRPVDIAGLSGFLPRLDMDGRKHADYRIGTRWLRCRARRSADATTVVEITDITDLKLSEGTLVNARDMAQLADRAKSEFLANMTHELRTPLNAIIGFAEVLRDELFGPIGSSEYKDFVGDIHSSGRHLLAIIDDILDLSKLEVGRRELRPEPIDLRGTIVSAARMIERRAQFAGLTLHIVSDDDLPLLNGEERSIKQILLNLLSNAVKFTDPGGSITVTAQRNRADGLDLSVADTGIGIARDDHARVFTPFVQIETGRSSQAAGAGLGLSLVKSLAEMHDAEIVLESSPGDGTTITVRFPPSALSEKSAMEAS